MSVNVTSYDNDWAEASFMNFRPQYSDPGIGTKATSPWHAKLSIFKKGKSWLKKATHLRFLPSV